MLVLCGAFWYRKCTEHQKTQKAPKCTEIVGEGKEVNTGKCKEHQKARRWCRGRARRGERKGNVKSSKKHEKNQKAPKCGGVGDADTEEMSKARKSTKSTKKHRSLGGGRGRDRGND